MVDFGPAGGDSRYVPEVLLVGSLHGDEVVGYEVLLQLTYHLCENYKKDFIITSVCILTLKAPPISGDDCKFCNIFKNNK